jgi:hypothetical protein
LEARPVRLTKAERLAWTSISGEPERRASALRWARISRGFGPNGRLDRVHSRVLGSHALPDSTRHAARPCWRSHAATVGPGSL